MAFPVIETTNTTNGTGATANATVNLPSGIQSGETLLVLFRAATTGVIGFPAGWEELFDNDTDASNDQTAMAWRLADGTEGATITVTLTSSKFAAVAYRISGAENPTVQPPEISTIAVGASTTPDPTAVTPTGGAKDYLFIWVGGWEGEQTSPPATAPVNYSTNWIGADSGTAAAVATNCRVAMGSRQLNAASEDPASVTISVSDQWTAYTVAVHPGAPPTINTQYFIIWDDTDDWQ